MPYRSTPLRLFAALFCLVLVSGCAAPLSERWQGYPLGASPGNVSDQAIASPTDQAGAVPDCSQVKCVALTFDDGPGTYTESLLSILDRYNAKATFFLIGKSVNKFPHIAKEELTKGHEIGNHTWSHQSLSQVSTSRAETELQKADAAIKEATGENPTLIRPPYGEIPENLKKSLKTPVALWSVDTMDWKTRNTKKTIKAAESITPGSIVLMHDIHKSTVDAMPKILADLAAQDYHFVTVSQLIGNPKPGVAYGTGQHPDSK